MNWQNADDVFEEETRDFPQHLSDDQHSNLDGHLKEKEKLQLAKFRDAVENTERQAYISILTHFGNLLVNNNIAEMTQNLLTEDCQFFLFNSTGKAPVLYSTSPNDLQDLYQHIQIEERRVRETHVDLEKQTVIQISNFKKHYPDEDFPIDEIVMEIFSFKNHKISKYRASFARMLPNYGDTDPFAPSRKDIVLAKVKQINCALVGEPDFEKLASLLSEDTEYKIWSWESQKKCFTCGKHNLVANFRDIQENLSIRCIVPYEIMTEAQFVVGNYVYHLEGKSEKYANKKFIWLSTCVYAFDDSLNIIKISQQGQLHQEGEVQIPFESYSRERIIQNIKEMHKKSNPVLDVFYSDNIEFACPVYRFGPTGTGLRGFFEGLNEIQRTVNASNLRNNETKQKKLMELFVDNTGVNYDVVVSVTYTEGIQYFSDSPNCAKEFCMIHISRTCFENGKIAKIMVFSSAILEPLPSPFDDLDFESSYILKKEN